jgi:hypothetical protein
VGRRGRAGRAFRGRVRRGERRTRRRRRRLDALIGELDDELARTGIRGNPDPGQLNTRRHRSTRRRQDAPDLPRRTIDPRTTGKVYTPPAARPTGPPCS